MNKKSFKTNKGNIVYWTNDFAEGKHTLVFLPGLTADHRLFDKQIEYFKDKANVLVWDAPGHAESRPFELDFKLRDKAVWLSEILEREKIEHPILVGQSMGGYVSQMYMELYPDSPAAFVSIDSMSLQKAYMTDAVIWSLKHVEPIYRMYPWKTLLRYGANGCATTAYGLKLMRTMMEEYNDDPRYYCHLTGHGYKILAEAIEDDLPYKITCPCVLVCGDKDAAGFTKIYNKRWAEKSGLPIRWIKYAGHNSNTDSPQEINRIIEGMLNY